MGWATEHIAQLQKGKTVKFRPFGGSMAGRVESGSLVTVEPVAKHKVKVDDIVLCRVGGNEYLHLVKGIADGLFQIGNAKGGINGWTQHVFGVCTKVEP